MKQECCTLNAIQKFFKGFQMFWEGFQDLGMVVLKCSLLLVLFLQSFQAEVGRFRDTTRGNQCSFQRFDCFSKALYSLTA